MDVVQAPFAFPLPRGERTASMIQGLGASSWSWSWCCSSSSVGGGRGEPRSELIGVLAHRRHAGADRARSSGQAGCRCRPEMAVDLNERPASDVVFVFGGLTHAQHRCDARIGAGKAVLHSRRVRLANRPAMAAFCAGQVATVHLVVRLLVAEDPAELGEELRLDGADGHEPPSAVSYVS